MRWADWRTGERALVLPCALLLVTCGDSLVDSVSAPRILSAVVEANPGNVLSAVVTTKVESGDSVVVHYGVRGAGLDSVTTALLVTAEPVEVPVLGLLPDTEYSMRVEAFGSSSAARGALIQFRTGALPPELPAYVASGSDPAPGFVVFAAGRYGLAIDNTGRVVWYHEFPNGPGLNFMRLPNGTFAARPTTPDPNDQDLWVEIDVLGRQVWSYGCARGLVTRFHDLIAEPDGSRWLLCDETRTADLSAVGGDSNARVTGTGVHHISASGVLLFEWSPFDHFAFTPFDPADVSASGYNWTHGNALVLDRDGNLLVSFRNLNEITRIDTRTGAVLWRLGGPANQFAFNDTPASGFARQHGLRVTGSGDLLLLDNLGEAAGSQAERYAWDITTHRVQLVREYVPASPVRALTGGTTQDLPEGHVLVSYGNGGRVEEYDAGGNVVWKIEGNPGYVFRATRTRSLY